MFVVQHVRATLRMGLLAVVFGATGLALTLTGLLLSPWPQHSAASRERIVDAASLALAWVVGMRVTVEGQPPARPFFLVSNHLGYMDILLVRRASGARFVSKAEIASWPLIGWVARQTGTLFLDRSNKRDLSRINIQIRDVLDSGAGIAVFPEGTSSAGLSVLRFHAGALSDAAERGYPVHAAALHYAVSQGPDPAHSICWWGDMTFVDHLYNLLKLPGFDARVTFAPNPLSGQDRRLLASKLESTVRDLFHPIEGAPPA